MTLSEREENSEAVALFQAAVRVPDEKIDLVEGALLIAQAEYSWLDRSLYRSRLAELGREAAAACQNRPTVLERLTQTQQLFFGRWGFRGNRKDYYDPRNSFLNDVLDRRTGIPITLSLVFIEVGRGAGMDLVGIGMPGHFLVGCAEHPDLYVDAFHGGLLTRQECAKRLRELRPDLTFRPEYLDPAGPRQTLTRMLNNLLEIYLHTERFPKALTIVEMILSADPGEPEWLRRRAFVHSHLKNYSQALADLETYLERVPQAPDRDEIAQQLSALAHLRSMVN